MLSRWDMAACLLAMSLAFASAQNSLPRGVNPADSAAYTTSKDTFTCLDGSKTIPYNRVNDNYCDCPGDGSDEPGTSACYYGKFYCANRGHASQLLASAFVDDGICDCCDGSDESATACTNTCLDKGAAARQEVRDKVDAMQRSLDIKQDLVNKAKERQAGWATRASSISSDIEQQEQEVARLEKAKAEAQAAAEEDRSNIMKQREADEQARAQKAAEQAAAELQAGRQDGKQGETQEETDEERGRRIAAQWTHDPEAAGDHAQAQGSMSSQQQQTSDGGDASSQGARPSSRRHSNTSAANNMAQAGTILDDLKLIWNNSCEYWRREWEDAKRFGMALQLFYSQVKEMVDDLMAGGLKELNKRRQERELARMQQRDAELEAMLKAQLERLEAPWRDPAWHEQAKRLQEAPQQQQQQGADATQQDEQPAQDTLQTGQPDIGVNIIDSHAQEPRCDECEHHAPLDYDEHYDHGDDTHSQEDYAEEPAPVWSEHDTTVYQLGGQLDAAKKKLEELRKEASDIARYHTSGVKLDFGPNDVFLPLAGRCFSDKGPRWTYEACFFETAKQLEPHNPSNKVSLGSWKGWAKDYTEAVFDNGDPCAGAPARSLTVRLQCGPEEKMWGGEEPATCVYAVHMATPLACNQSDLQKEKDKLSQLERFEAEVRAEIVAAEKAKSTSRKHDEL